MRLAVLLAIVAFPLLARAADHAAALGAADRQLTDGAYAEAEAAAGALAADPSLLPAERGEAQRIRGLALFFLGRREEAEQAVRAYLALEPDAHLDPALVPPEAVVFFEEVRARHAGEVRAARPRPKRRRYLWANLFPPFGQIQNGQSAKAWTIAGLEVALLAANITTYAMLRSSCHTNLTCDRDPASARNLRIANLATGAAFFGVYAYGVIDGLLGYRSAQAEPVRAALVPVPGGVLVGAAGSFRGL